MTATLNKKAWACFFVATVALVGGGAVSALTPHTSIAAVGILMMPAAVFLPFLYHRRERGERLSLDDVIEVTSNIISALLMTVIFTAVTFFFYSLTGDGVLTFLLLAATVLVIGTGVDVALHHSKEEPLLGKDGAIMSILREWGKVVAMIVTRG